MTEPRGIHWQPISALPTVAHVVNELLENSQEQYATLAAARRKPHVLDDELLDRVVRLYTERLHYLRLYRQQLDRWKQEQPTTQQRQELHALNGQITHGEEIGQAILTLVEDLRKGTINRILEMDEAELALKILSGELKLPGHE